MILEGAHLMSLNERWPFVWGGELSKISYCISPSLFSTWSRSFPYREWIAIRYNRNIIPREKTIMKILLNILTSLLSVLVFTGAFSSFSFSINSPFIIRYLHRSSWQSGCPYDWLGAYWSLSAVFLKCAIPRSISTPEITILAKMSACMGSTVIADYKTKLSMIRPATVKNCLIIFSFPDAFRWN